MFLKFLQKNKLNENEYYVVDRIENRYIVLESLETKRIINYKTKQKFNEGDILKYIDGSLIIDEEMMKIRKNKIKEKMDKLKRR